MKTGTLTPRSNDTVDAMRFSGGFGQPDGFGSVLTARVNRAGDLTLTLEYRKGMSTASEDAWSIVLTNEQRLRLAAFAGKYAPRLCEIVEGEEGEP